MISFLMINLVMMGGGILDAQGEVTIKRKVLSDLINEGKPEQNS